MLNDKRRCCSIHNGFCGTTSTPQFCGLINAGWMFKPHSVQRPIKQASEQINSCNIFPLNVKTKAIFSVQIKYIPLYNISFAAYMSRCQTVLCTGRCSAASFGSANSAFGSHVFNKRCFLTPNVLHSVESKWLQWHHLHLAFLSILVQFRVAISEFVC